MPKGGGLVSEILDRCPGAVSCWGLKRACKRSLGDMVADVKIVGPSRCSYGPLGKAYTCLVSCSL